MMYMPENLKVKTKSSIKLLRKIAPKMAVINSKQIS